MHLLQPLISWLVWGGGGVPGHSKQPWVWHWNAHITISHCSRIVEATSSKGVAEWVFLQGRNTHYNSWLNTCTWILTSHLSHHPLCCEAVKYLLIPAGLIGNHGRFLLTERKFYDSLRLGQQWMVPNIRKRWNMLFLLLLWLHFVLFRHLLWLLLLVVVLIQGETFWFAAATIHTHTTHIHTIHSHTPHNTYACTHTHTHTHTNMHTHPKHRPNVDR